MKKSIGLIFYLILVFGISANSINASNDKKVDNTFKLNKADYGLSPLTGMTRDHWLDAAEYVLDGAFSYIHSLDDPMKFPKQHDKTYPHNDGQVATEKLEGFCRTLFVAAPLLKEKPDLKLNNIKVADYYRHNLLNLIQAILSIEAMEDRVRFLLNLEHWQSRYPLVAISCGSP